MRYYEYKKLYDQGLTCNAIAQHFGVTRQAVWSCLKHGSGYGIGRPPEYDTVFPKINRWLEEHGSSIHEMERKSGVHLRRGLKSGGMTKRAVDAVLRITGMTYDEAFMQ